MKDFHFESLHQAIAPMLLKLPSVRTSNFRLLSVKLDGKNLNAAIRSLRDTWQKFAPETPFEVTYLDNKLGQLYTSEKQQGNLFTLFSGVAIIIACLGLFGLSAFTIGQRVKEIGVRKVLGASVGQIVYELSKDFLLLVGVATLIAVPVAVWLMQEWLADFASHTELSWWIFAVAATLALVIAFATISFQSIKAARANPVDSLRSE